MKKLTSPIALIVAAAVASMGTIAYFKYNANNVVQEKQAVETVTVQNDSNVTKNNIVNNNYVEKYIEGKHYKVTKNINVNITDAPYIVEYFWLGCSHCQRFDPALSVYASENDNLKIVKRHAALNPRWGMDAKIYYALLEIGQEQHFEDLFKMYKETAKDRRLPNKEDIIKFLESKNINVEEFFKASESESVQEKISIGIKEMTENVITGVPVVVVNGKYMPIPNEDITSTKDYFELIDFLKNKK